MVRQDRLTRDTEAAMTDDYMLTRLVCPMARYQAKGRAAEVASHVYAPDGWDVAEHNFTDEQWRTVCDAYSKDDSTFLKVKLS